MQRLQNRRQKSERGQTTENKSEERQVEGEKRKSKPIIVMRDSQM